jgi:hypothetical protein
MCWLLQARPVAIANLRNVAEGYLSWAESSEPRYAHITAEERAPIATAARDALIWLGALWGLQWCRACLVACSLHFAATAGIRLPSA